jgi:hypothetical protein
VSNSLDAFWERLARRSRRFALSDATDDQTHRNHALVTVLLFGSLGGIAGRFLTVYGAEWGLRWGLVLGVAFYVVREIWWRAGIVWLRWHTAPYDSAERIVKSRTPLKLWDGVMDVLVPVWVVGPVLYGSPALLWWLSAAVAAGYFLFRPLE